MKKFFSLLFLVIFIQVSCLAKDIIQFDFPNDGWHKINSPDGVESKKCYVPYNQTAENYNEMLILTERAVKTEGISPMILLHRQLGKDKNNYFDIHPEYIYTDENNAMVTWCSQARNTCVVQRAFKGEQGIIMATYINRAPHYSQNLFGQWPNILSHIKVYTKINEETKPSNLIEL